MSNTYAATVPVDRRVAIGTDRPQDTAQMTIAELEDTVQLHRDSSESAAAFSAQNALLALWRQGQTDGISARLGFSPDDDELLVEAGDHELLHADWTRALDIEFAQENSFGIDEFITYEDLVAQAGEWKIITALYGDRCWTFTGMREWLSENLDGYVSYADVADRRAGIALDDIAHAIPDDVLVLLRAGNEDAVVERLRSARTSELAAVVRDTLHDDDLAWVAYESTLLLQPAGSLGDIADRYEAVITRLTAMQPRVLRVVESCSETPFLMTVSDLVGRAGRRALADAADSDVATDDELVAHLMDAARGLRQV